MPSKSKKQARTMAAAAHNPKFAKKVGIPVKVAKDFNQADAGTGILSGPKKKPAAKQVAMIPGTPAMSDPTMPDAPVLPSSGLSDINS